MNHSGHDLKALKDRIKIADLADHLGLEVKRNQARCYNTGAHKNNDQHFSLGLDIATNRYKCFGCDVKGSVIDLYIATRGVDLSQAIKDLAGMAGLQQPETTTNAQNSRQQIDATGEVIRFPARDFPW